MGISVGASSTKARAFPFRGGTRDNCSSVIQKGDRPQVRFPDIVLFDITKENFFTGFVTQTNPIRLRSSANPALCKCFLIAVYSPARNFFHRKFVDITRLIATELTTIFRAHGLH